MKFHNIKCSGKFIVQRVSSLPIWTKDDEGRIVYVNSDKQLYYGTNKEWGRVGIVDNYIKRIEQLEQRLERIEEIFE